MTDVPRQLLMYCVFPLWVAAGLADWWLHRRSAIEATSGLRESLFHLALFAQMGVAVLMAMLLEVNALVLLLLAVLFALHEATTWTELRFVQRRREIGPAEQMVHSFMEILPLAGILLLAAMAQAGAATGWSLRWRDPPLSPAYLAGALAAAALFNGLPLAEEALRCARARSRSSA